MFNISGFVSEFEIKVSSFINTRHGKLEFYIQDNRQQELPHLKFQSIILPGSISSKFSSYFLPFLTYSVLILCSFSTQFEFLNGSNLFYSTPLINCVNCQLKFVYKAHSFSEVLLNIISKLILPRTSSTLKRWLQNKELVSLQEDLDSILQCHNINRK